MPQLYNLTLWSPLEAPLSPLKVLFSRQGNNESSGVQPDPYEEFSVLTHAQVRDCWDIDYQQSAVTGSR